MHWLKLIRLPNLLILGLTLYLLLARLIHPLLLADGIIPQLSSKDILLFVFIVMSIAAGGYIHNDILDVTSDEVNGKRGIFNSKVSIQAGYWLYGFFVLTPIIPALYLSLELQEISHLNFYFLTVLALFMYNQFLKRMALVGNLLIAFLCGFVVMSLLLAEAPGLSELYAINRPTYINILSIVFAYAYFSFYINLIREIVKDIEDIRGDLADGHRTLPIVLSINKTSWIISVMTFILLSSIAYWLTTFPIANTLKYHGFVLLIIPLIMGLTCLLFYIRTPAQYGVLSQAIKIYFLAGLLFLHLLIEQII